MGINITKRRTIWFTVIGISILIMVLAVGQYAKGGAPVRGIGTPLYVTDITDDRKLAGLSDHIWIGQVVSKTGQDEAEDKIPATHYSITVFESLKGTLGETVPVVLEGEDLSDGREFRMEGAPNLLRPGKSYLFVALADSRGELRLVPGVGSQHIDVAENASKETVLASDDAVKLRERLQAAIADEIPFESGG